VDRLGINNIPCQDSLIHDAKHSKLFHHIHSGIGLSTASSIRLQCFIKSSIIKVKLLNISYKEDPCYHTIPRFLVPSHPNLPCQCPAHLIAVARAATRATDPATSTPRMTPGMAPVLLMMPMTSVTAAPISGIQSAHRTRTASMRTTSVTAATMATLVRAVLLVFFLLLVFLVLVL